jgi:Zn-finger nucleic acid-binding protein
MLSSSTHCSVQEPHKTCPRLLICLQESPCQSQTLVVSLIRNDKASETYVICPVCTKDMIVVEHNRIELDYCPNCRGVWFDAGELELLLESMKLDGSGSVHQALLGLNETQTAEKKRPCPLCRSKMRKVTLPPKILVDLCPRGEGLWFDGGELDSLLNYLAKTGECDTHSAICFLAEVFRPKEESK